jgi:hypothetical protein
VFQPVTLMGFLFRSEVLAKKSADHWSRAAWKTMRRTSCFHKGPWTTEVALRPILLRRTGDPRKPWRNSFLASPILTSVLSH